MGSLHLHKSMFFEGKASKVHKLPFPPKINIGTDPDMLETIIYLWHNIHHSECDFTGAECYSGLPL